MVPEVLLLGRNDAKLIAMTEEVGIDADTTDYGAAIGSSEHALFFGASATAMRDGMIVTAQTWQSHLEFYRELLRCLESPAGEHD